MTSPSFRALVTAAALAAGLVTTGAAAAAPTSEPPADLPHPQLADAAARAISYQPCNPDGPTEADDAVAGRLNRVLTAGLQDGMNGQRVACAREVVQAVRNRGLPERAAVIAVTTTIVESTILNGDQQVDHDSLGLFQQRDSWGTREQRLDPTWATNAFLNAMQREYPEGSWQDDAIGVVCQEVQVSAFPDRYELEASDAARIVDALWEGGPPQAETGVLTGSLQDFTGDGRVDLVARREDGLLFRYDGTGTGSFSPVATEIGGGWNIFTAIAATPDITGDGHADVIARDKAGLLWRYDGTGAGSVKPGPTQIGGGWNTNTAIVPTEDLTGDGHADLVARRQDGRLLRYDGTGTGFFSRYGTLIGGGWNDYTAIVSPGDMNSDGRADLVGRRADGILFRYSGTGTGYFAGRGTQIGGDWSMYTAIVGGDLNGDRRGDLLARDAAGLLWRYWGTGTGYVQNSRTRIGGGWNVHTEIG